MRGLAGKRFVGLVLRVGPQLLDQALSSVSNVLAVVMVARALGAEGFGRFAVVFAVLTLVLGVCRGLLGTRVGLQPTAAATRIEGDAMLGLVVLAAPSIVLLVAAVAVTLVGDLGPIVVVVSLAAPVVCAQDLLRHVAIAGGRAWVAVASDGSWCAGLLVPLVSGWEPDATRALGAWLVAAVLALGVAVVGLRPRPSLRRASTLWRQRVPISESVALASLTGAGAALLVTTVAATVVGPAAAGALRGASTLMGPLNSLFAWSAIALTPAVVRRPAAARGRACVLASIGLAATALAWCAVVLLVPDSWGTALLADTWDGARAVLGWTSVEFVALAVGAGATLGLKVGGHARVLTQQKTAYAIGLVAVATLSALWLGTAVAVAGALALAAVTATGFAWWRLARLSDQDRSHAPVAK
ncbi:hypothetical protein [Knoellia sp. LjRoot47]|uniref:hypothetical protein n=1 Tax=Knoellia sp. LjRoot47 TaxID=3342330 RepID=UPI003ED16C87